MFSDPETKHWQEEYAKGNIPEEWLEDCAGETLALLDGSAMDVPWAEIVLICVICFALAAVLTSGICR